MLGAFGVSKDSTDRFHRRGRRERRATRSFGGTFSVISASSAVNNLIASFATVHCNLSPEGLSDLLQAQGKLLALDPAIPGQNGLADARLAVDFDRGVRATH
jgi:hypothetical protein